MKARSYPTWLFAVYRVDRPTEIQGATVEAPTAYLAARKLTQRYGPEYRYELVQSYPPSRGRGRGDGMSQDVVSLTWNDEMVRLNTLRSVLDAETRHTEADSILYDIAVRLMTTRPVIEQEQLRGMLNTYLAVS